ncbi:MAG TPA: hypothetical protein VIM65_23580, partial [Cyclobacteriaceae bacterium]
QLDGGQYIPWKSVTTSQSDPVAATLEGDIPTDKVRFEINGVNIPATAGNKTFTLNVPGKSEGMVEELLALYTPNDTAKDNVLGKLNLVSYDQITRNLVIVPVNGAAIPGGLTENILVQKLSDIYGQAVAAWNVEIRPSIKVSLDDTFDDGESGLLTNYTGDMKKVIKTYGNLLDNTYYIFLVTKPKSGATLGYMPRSKQAGFIFVDKLNSTTVVNTLAHEIGHGAFNLQHTFKEYPLLAQGSTDNLMDYANGTALYKYQWDYIHDPQKVIGLFEDDEDAASICTWYKGVISYLFPSETDEQLNERETLYAHIHSNFEKYFDASQTDNTEIEGFKTWSARKSSFNKKNNLTLVERVVKKLLENQPTFSLSNKGIFLGKYTIEGKEFKIAFYSEIDAFDIEKVTVQDICDLVDHEVIKVVLEDDYTLISFFKEGQLKMVVQIESGDEESAKLWLRYLGILVEGPSMLEKVKVYWNSLWEEEEQQKDNATNKYEEILIDEVKWVSQFDKTLFGEKACFCKKKKDGSCMNVCCNAASKYILSQFNLTSVKNSNCLAEKIADDNYGSVRASGDFAKALKVLETYIKPREKGGEPILIGVHYPKNAYPGYENDCSATFHYMIVVGKGYDEEKKMNYFRFYDVGRTEESYGADPLNRLYVDVANKTISGLYKNKLYTITEIRSNHE